MAKVPLLPFYIHYLHEPTKQYINGVLAKQGFKLPETYKQEQYEILNARLCKTYSRTNQYTQSFMSSWSIDTAPGYIIYAADGEKLNLYHSKNRKTCSKELVDKIIKHGNILIYYGEAYFPEYEAYITAARASQLKAKIQFNNIPLLEEKVIKRGTVSPFYESIRMLKVGNIAMLSRAPNYIKALDSLVSGHSIFNDAGDICMPEFFATSATRIVSPIPFRDLVVINDVNEIQQDDVLCEPPEWLVSKFNSQHVSAVVSYFKRKGMRMVGETHFTEVLLKSDRSSYRLTTFISIKQLITFISQEGIPKPLISILLLTSFADTLPLKSSEIEKICAICPIKPVTKAPSLALVSSALQMRKTFLWNNEMGIAVIAPKGSMKTTLISVLTTCLPGVIIIDSDTYGKWIGLVSKKRSVPSLLELGRDDCDEPSFFEQVAVDILNTYKDKTTCYDGLEHFRRVYAYTLAHPEWGIAKFQDAIANEFHHTQVLLFLHTTVEANLMSGKWQQIIIRPIHDTLEAVKSRNRPLTAENVFLHDAYKYLTPTSNRSCLSWVEFMILLNPDMLSVMENKFFDELRKCGKYV